MAREEVPNRSVILKRYVTGPSSPQAVPLGSTVFLLLPPVVDLINMYC
jgi:hypothetical protein